MLILRRDMPRSLLACSGEVAEILERLREDAKCTHLANQILERLKRNRIDGILRSGLPPFLGAYLANNNELHTKIGQEFMLIQ